MSDDKKTSVWSKYTAEERAAVNELAQGYIDFLSNCKTERESVTEAVRLAKAAGYRDLADIIAQGLSLKAGDKVYAVNMKKAIVLFHIGEAPIESGMNILGAHIDTCRLMLSRILSMRTAALPISTHITTAASRSISG